jgi:amino acid adenylation domain-containing protein
MNTNILSFLPSDVSDNNNIVHLFEEQTCLNSHKTALIAKEETVTYSRLNNYANQIAHHLRKLLAERSPKVGIFLPRSVDCIAGILGILKSGGTYIPIDPEYPEEWIRFVSQDSSFHLLLTESGLVSHLPNYRGEVLLLDREKSLLLKESADNLHEDMPKDTIAYILYTSETTGKPKGTMTTHGNLYHFIQTVRSLFNIQSHDIVACTASVSFALAVRQLLVPLASGAAILVVERDYLQNPLALFELIKRHQATMMDMVPSYWRSCNRVLAGLEATKRQELLDNCLSRISSVGEPLTYDTVRQWRVDFQHKAQIVNVYGQTETTGLNAFYPVDEVKNNVQVVPIGRPTGITQSYILDANLMPVPENEEGELYVHNPCLSIGYLQQPGLTAEKFVPNPFSDLAGARLYKTGDLARRLADGNIELRGRKDNQVKIRGQRVELSEIEANLRVHPLLQEAVVITTDSEEDLSLYAYVVAKSPAPSVEEIRDFLNARVPSYMIPIRFVYLAAVPLTPSGKIDFMALRKMSPLAVAIPPEARKVNNKQAAPESLRSHIKALYVAPRNGLEVLLVEIWEKVLDLHPIGIRDDFFTLGGTSLQAVTLIAELTKGLGRDLPLDALSQNPTIEKMAAILGNPGKIWFTQTVLSINEHGSKCPLFCVCGVFGNALRFLLVGRALSEEQPLYALQPPNMDWSSCNCTTIEEMATRYLQEVRRIQPQGPYQLLGTSLGGNIAFEMAIQLQEQGEKVRWLGMLDTRIPSLKVREFPDNPDPIMQNGFKIAKAHYKAVGQYRLKAKFQGKITYFLCSGHLVMPKRKEGRLEWNKFATEGMEILPVPGYHGHFHLFPQFPVFVEKLAKALDEVLSQSYRSDTFLKSFVHHKLKKDDKGNEQIVSLLGKQFQVTAHETVGALESITYDAGEVHLRGWAFDGQRQHPIDKILVFMDGVFLGLGGAGFERSEDDPLLRCSGFWFKIPEILVKPDLASRLLLFALDEENLTATPLYKEKSYFVAANHDQNKDFSTVLEMAEEEDGEIFVQDQDTLTSSASVSSPQVISAPDTTQPKPVEFKKPHPNSILFITLDSCRYDTFISADIPHIKSIGNVYRAMAPGNFTYSSHAAMFVGFTPGIPEIAASFINPKYGRIFKIVVPWFAGKGREFISLEGPNIVVGLKRKGYYAAGSGAVEWFDAKTEAGIFLGKDFDKFYHHGMPWSVRSQLTWLAENLVEVTQPLFLFLNIGETHIPYYYEGAPWNPQYVPCIPFSDKNDATECRRRQKACLEYVDRELSSLINAFSDASTILCADHGDCWGEDGLWAHGISHEKVLEVPLVLRLAGVSKESLPLPRNEKENLKQKVKIIETERDHIWQQLEAITTSKAWKLARKLQKIRSILAPDGSIRHRFLKAILQKL